MTKANHKVMEESAKRILKDGLPKIDMVAYMREFLSTSWIPIEEPPQRYQYVLVWCKYANDLWGCHMVSRVDDGWEDLNGEPCDLLITHWMPLPTKPKV